jgi:hypothetical protein
MTSDAEIRIDRHDAGPRASWEATLALTQEQRATILARRPRADDGRALLVCDLERAALMSMLGRPCDEVADTMARGAGGGAAGAMAQAARDGAVLLREPAADAPRVIPVGDAAMTPLMWRDALMLSLIVRDANAQTILLDPARIDACQMGSDRADAFWPPFCRALAAVVEGRDSRRAEIAAAFAAMDRIETADPDVVAALDRPLLTLASALDGAEADWSAAVADALDTHRDWFEAQARRYDRTGFLAIGVLGLCAIAHDRGIRTRVVSEYVPADLICGRICPPLSSVARIAGAASQDTVEDMAFALAASETLKQLLRPALAALRGPGAKAAMTAFRPRDEDYAKVFVGEAVTQAHEKYEALWQAPPPFPAPDPLRTEVHIELSPAGMLDHDNALSQRFPGGYRVIAAKLNPARIWAAWEFTQPGQTTGLAFDGLVWCDDHWAWFPRPYELLGRRD